MTKNTFWGIFTTGMSAFGAGEKRSSLSWPEHQKMSPKKCNVYMGHKHVHFACTLGFLYLYLPVSQLPGIAQLSCKPCFYHTRSAALFAGFCFSMISRHHSSRPMAEYSRWNMPRKLSKTVGESLLNIVAIFCSPINKIVQEIMKSLPLLVPVHILWNFGSALVNLASLECC